MSGKSPYFASERIPDNKQIKNIGLGVARGNAVDEVKEHADLVIGTNIEPGISEVVKKHFL